MPHLRILVDPFSGQRILRVLDDRRFKEVAEYVTGHLLHDWERTLADVVSVLAVQNCLRNWFHSF